MRIGLARLAALLAALVAWGGLAIQLWLLIGNFEAQGKGAGEALWRYFGFFTILTNLGVAVVATAMAAAPQSRIASPRPRLVMAAAIAVVGIVYSVALRHIWNPQGWQAVADHALHDLSPPLFLIAWVLADHGNLRWRDTPWVLSWSTAYLAYAMVRGAMDGWYAYWFLDPASQPPVQFALSIALLLAGFLLTGLALVAADRWLARRGAG